MCIIVCQIERRRKTRGDCCCSWAPVSSCFFNQTKSACVNLLSVSPLSVLFRTGGSMFTSTFSSTYCRRRATFRWASWVACHRNRPACRRLCVYSNGSEAGQRNRCRRSFSQMLIIGFVFGALWSTKGDWKHNRTHITSVSSVSVSGSY